MDTEEASRKSPRRSLALSHYSLLLPVQSVSGEESRGLTLTDTAAEAEDSSHSLSLPALSAAASRPPKRRRRRMRRTFERERVMMSCRSSFGAQQQLIGHGGGSRVGSGMQEFVKTQG